MMEISNKYLEDFYAVYNQSFDNIIIAMSQSMKTDRKYALKVEKPSRVLLVCVYDTIVFQISNDAIMSKFEKFGKITKLLIFEKGEVTKFFIEYEQVQQASKARSSLDGTKLCDSICKMTIYYSNFSNVDLKHQASQGVDFQGYFEILKQQKTAGQLGEYSESSCREETDRFSDCFEEQVLFKTFSPFQNFQRSKTDNPKTLLNEIAKISRFEEMANKVIFEDEIDHSIKKSIDSILGPSFSEEPSEKVQVLDKGLKMKEETDVRSSVLYFAFRYPLKTHCIYNLFSNFGNISCIVIKKDNIYIKFRTKEFAAIATTYLNNMTLQGNQMILKQCMEASESWRPTQGEYCQCTYFDSTSDRFTAQRSITINPPSQTIHVSSMKREICKEHSLRDIFSEYGNVDRVHILQQSNEKNMALVKFRTVQDSFNAIANLHNESFMGRKMQISFTKSKV